MAEALNAQLSFAADENLHLNDYMFYSTITDKKIEV
jgi:ribonuclease G